MSDAASNPAPGRQMMRLRPHFFGRYSQNSEMYTAHYYAAPALARTMLGGSLRPLFRNTVQKLQPG
jgi:hypothetical protein